MIFFWTSYNKCLLSVYGKTRIFGTLLIAKNPQFLRRKYRISASVKLVGSRAGRWSSHQGRKRRVYNSRFYFIRAWQARSRIQSRRSPGAFFANFHPGFASSLPVAFGSIYRATYTISPHFSFAPSPIVSQFASRINDGTGRRSLVAVDNSRFRYRSYFSAMFAIAKQSEPGSTSVRHFGANSSPDDAFECRLFIVPCSFNESGISSILSPTTWRTVRNRIWTRYRILMATPITDSRPYVGESFDCTKV